MMASMKLNSQTAVLLSVASFLLLLQFPQVHAQITTPCTPTGITGLTPCMNFLTNSSANGASSSPTEDCCNSLKNLTGASMDCICLVLAAGVPFQVPINRNLAISLPRTCNMPGIPLQCKAAAGSPVPAPGPAALGPSLAPGVSPSDTPSSSVVPGTPSDGTTPGSGTTTPGSGTTTPSGMTPPSSTTGTTPTPTSINSSPPSSYSFSPSLLLLALALLLVKFN